MLTDKERARFWAKISAPVAGDGCWPWIGALMTSGYGHIWFRGRGVNACHVALEMDGRPRIDGASALHSCDNRCCCNPAHLRWGTQAENIADRQARGRQKTLRGEDNHSAKLKIADVIAIRHDKRTQRVIAENHGISRALVSLVKSRKVWAHVA